MLKNNLAVLLAERGYSATDVHEATKISKTTLTSLINNTGKGVQFDTINTLCKFLKITPSDFFLYSRFDYEIVNFYENDIYNSYTNPKTGDIEYLETGFKLVVYWNDGVYPFETEYPVIRYQEFGNKHSDIIIFEDNADGDSEFTQLGYKSLMTFFCEAPKIFINDFVQDVRRIIEVSEVFQNEKASTVPFKILDRVVNLNFSNSN